MGKKVSNKGAALYKCPECSLKYKDKEIAEKCENWCREHKSCNLDIISYAQNDDDKNIKTNKKYN